MPNILWAGMNGANIADLYDKYLSFYQNLSKGFDLQQIRQFAGEQVTDPIIGPLIFLGVVPIVFGLISLLCCIPVNCCMCCCPYMKYKKVQQKLDKKLTRYIKKNRVAYEFKPKKGVYRKIMFDVVASQPPSGKESDVQELNKLKQKSDKLFLKAFGCQCFGLTFYVLFFVCLAFYLVSIVLLGLAANNTTRLPQGVYGSIQSVASNVDGVLGKSFRVIDDQIGVLTATNGSNISVFSSLISGTQEDFQDNCTAFEAAYGDMGLIRPVLDGLDALIERNNDSSSSNDKSLARWLENIIFWPQVDNLTAKDAYNRKGQDAADRIVGNIRDLDKEIYNLGKNMTEIENAVLGLPGNIKDSFDTSDVGNKDYDGIVSVIRGTNMNLSMIGIVEEIVNKDMTKYSIARRFVEVAREQVSNIPVELYDVLINKTDTGADASRSMPLYEILNKTAAKDIVGYLDSKYYEDMIKGYMPNASTLESMGMYQPYIQLLQKLANTSVGDFLLQLEDHNCSELWCGLLPSGTFENINNTISTIPVVNNLLTYQGTPDHMLDRARPIIIAACVIVPCIIFLSVGISMMCFKMCCPKCTMCCCSICNIIVGILSLAFLVVSFANSGVLQPMSFKLTNDLNGLVNSGLLIQSNTGAAKTISVELPNVSMLYFEPNRLDINLASVEEMFKSIKFQVKFVSSNDSSIISAMFPSNFSINVDLSGTNLNGLFGASERSILSFIGDGDNAIDKVLSNTLLSITNGVNKEMFHSMISQVLNPDQLFNLSDYIGDINITQFLNDVTTEQNFDNIQQVVDTAKKNISDILNESKTMREFESLTDKFNQCKDTGCDSVNTSIDAVNETGSVDIIDGLYIDLYLEYLSEGDDYDQTVANGATAFYDTTLSEIRHRNFSIYENIKKNHCDDLGNGLKEFITRYNNSDDQCNNIVNQPPHEEKFKKSMENRGVNLDPGTNVTPMMRVRCQIIKNMIKADPFAKVANGEYPICSNHNVTGQIRLEGEVIRSGLENASQSVSKLKNMLTASGGDQSMLNTMEGDFNDFIDGVQQNIQETLKVNTSFQVFTIYDALGTGLISALHGALNTVTNVTNELIGGVFNTRILNLVPTTVQTLGNGALSGFDEYSMACYFGFIFYFVGCSVCITLSYNFLVSQNYERYITKTYGVRRHRLTCCGDSYLTREQTEYKQIGRRKNYLIEQPQAMQQSELIMAVSTDSKPSSPSGHSGGAGYGGNHGKPAPVRYVLDLREKDVW